VCRFCNPTAAVVTETAKTESKSNKPDPAFLWADGSTYDSGKDAWRLGRQQAAVWTILANAGWVPLHVVTRRVTDLLGQQCSDAAISARIRDLRKLRNGLHIVDCQRVEDSGTFEYRLVESGTEEWVRRWDELTPQVAASTDCVAAEDMTREEMLAELADYDRLVLYLAHNARFQPAEEGVVEMPIVEFPAGFVPATRRLRAALGGDNDTL
jgi:hypothetical protein